MKRTGFSYRIESEVEFTGYELARLLEIGQHHYDGACQSAVREGGIIRSWGMSWTMDNKKPWRTTIEKMIDELKESGDETLSIIANGTELGIAAKIMEMEGIQCGMDMETPTGLTFAIGQVLKAMNEEHQRLNPS